MSPTLSPATGATSVTVHRLVRVGDNQIEIFAEPTGEAGALSRLVEEPINFAVPVAAMRNARELEEPDMVLGSGPLGI